MRLGALFLLVLPLGAWAQTAPAPAPLPEIPSSSVVYQSNAPVVAPPSTPVDRAARVPFQAPALAQTAQEQGMIEPPADPGRAAREAADAAQANSPRQLGQTVAVPAPLAPVGRTPGQAAWVSAWVQRLSSVGVAETKSRFEADRLTQEAFEQWASRQVWASAAAPSTDATP